MTTTAASDVEREPPETCLQCCFDGAQYDLDDALGTLRALPPMWRSTVEGINQADLLARPAPAVWSAAEYTAHAADVTQAMGRLLTGLLTIDGLEVEAVPEGHAPDVRDGFEAMAIRLTENLERLRQRALRVGPEADERWRRTALAGGHRVDGAWVLRHAIHDARHHLHDIGRGLHRLGAGAPRQAGRVAHLHRSDGGVPKASVSSGEVGMRGLIGDRQADRRNHGRPMQALCLWSAEVIDALRSEGHPIAPGLAGENLTLSGLDWGTIRPGTQLRIGKVLAEVSAYATPCAKNADWFVDRDFNRMHHDGHPGWSRLYAWVLEPGAVSEGDEVIVEP
ncbi:MAG: MOSC domain-containing protein [Acidimicrobiales bacterium]